VQIKVEAYSFGVATPRHEYDYHVFEQGRLPARKIFIPEVLSHGMNLIF